MDSRTLSCRDAIASSPTVSRMEDIAMSLDAAVPTLLSIKKAWVGWCSRGGATWRDKVPSECQTGGGGAVEENVRDQFQINRELPSCDSRTQSHH